MAVSSEDLVPALRALAAKDLWQNAVEFFFEEHWVDVETRSVISPKIIGGMA
jgi:hypothetical protein